MWQVGQIVDVTISSLSESGDGVGRWCDRVIFVPDTAPGDRLLVRLEAVKPTYAHGRRQQLLSASPQRIRPACIVADKCGGCQWQHINYSYQQQAKYQQIVDAIERIGNVKSPPLIRFYLSNNRWGIAIKRRIL